MHSEQSTRSYINYAMQAMELAYATNRDPNVGQLISRAISAVRELGNTLPYSASHGSWDNDPYEIDNSNSAV